MILDTPNLYLVMQPIKFIGKETEYEILTRVKGQDSAEALISSVIAARKEMDFDLEVVCKALEATPGDMKIAVNMLPRTLEDLRLFDYIDNMVVNIGKDRSKLTLEINEDTNCMSNNVLQNILKFKSMGYRISLDDFSGRDCDFHLLEKTRPDAVKFDRSLVGNIGTGSIIKTLNKKGLDTILEGVETVEDVKRAKELGYTGLQGYFIGRPYPVKGINGGGVLLDNSAVSFDYKD